jgi:LPS-assembly lipoprotein
MSWCRPSRRTLLAALPLLAACGFTPLYGEGTPAAGMAGRVDVAPILGGPGFAMREELTRRLGPASAPTHVLEVEFALDRVGVALTQENVTTRYNVVGIADYRLTPLAGGAPVLTGSLRAVTGYSAPAENTGSAFASRAAERDAGQRLAVDLADQIVERLALSAGDWL